MKTLITRASPALLLLALACSQEPAAPGPISADLSAPTATDYEAIDLGVTLDRNQVESVSQEQDVFGLTAFPDASQHVFHWQAGVLSDFAQVPAGYVASNVSEGGVAGGLQCPDPSCPGTNISRGFVLRNGAVTAFDLGFTANFGRAVAVTDDGAVLIRIGAHSVRFANGAPIEIVSPKPGGITGATGMNKHLQVTGTTEVPGYRAPRAFVWDGSLHILPELTPLPCSDNPAEQCTYASAAAINDRGDVAGQSNNADGFIRAVLWPGGGAPIELPGLSAQYLNNKGQVIIINEFGQPDLWDNGTVMPITGLGGDVTPLDINDKGWVTGISRNNNGAFHAFVWTNGTVIDLGAGPGVSSRGLMINKNGDVLGWYAISDFSQVQHAMLWRRVEE